MQAFALFAVCSVLFLPNRAMRRALERFQSYLRTTQSARADFEQKVLRPARQAGAGIEGQLRRSCGPGVPLDLRQAADS